MGKANKFGVFGGVFVPSILTILGVIMYMRLPMIVGEAGLWYTLGIIVIAHIISITTGLSISSIATNKKVEAGGPYYIISRSLGLPIGGTLGLALFVGLSFSVSLYLIGFSESFVSFLGYEVNIHNIRIAGSIALLLLTVITFISTSLAIKAQYVILAAVLLSLVSIFLGKHDFAPSSTLFFNPSSSVSLMVLFGIFFPSVTGFTAGVSMSGDLKDPKKAIPIGTIAAIGVGFLVYMALAIFLATTVAQDKLINDSEVLLNTAWIPELVLAGIWGATLSSALGSILGAPRILQAISKDKITPSFFGKGHGAANEPRNAILLAFLIAEAGILIGELDVIARIVSIFFITTYGILNLTAAFEKWTSLDFQPDFKISGWISITGAVASMLVMIQLDMLALVGAIIVLGGVYLLLKRKELNLESGDAWAGVWASLVKAGLTRLAKDQSKMRNWRPNIIMFSGNPHNRQSMVELGKAIVGKLGILSAFELEESSEKVLAKTSSDLVEHKDAIGYFQHKYHCRDIYNGMDEIARIYGFSGIEPNTIMMGWSKQEKAQPQFLSLLESFHHNKYNSLFFNYNHEKKFGNYQNIDVWWSGSSRNLSLALYLLRQITNDRYWRSVNLRLLIINPNDRESEKVYASTLRILKEYRFDMEVKVVDNGSKGLATKEIIANESQNADLTILGVPETRYLDLKTYYDEIDGIVNLLGTSLVINASTEFEFLEVIENGELPKSSKVGQGFTKALPIIPTTSFEEINAEVAMQDARMQEAISIYFENAVQPIFSGHINVLKSLESRLETLNQSCSEIAAIPELVKRKRAINKLKGDTIFQLNKLINEELKENQVNRQQEALEDGTLRLLNRLSETVTSSNTLKLSCDKALFQISSEDNWRLKWYKRRKLFFQKLTGKPIIHQIYFRNAVSLLMDKNIVFVDKWLVQLLKDEISFYDQLRSVIKSLIKNISDIEHKIDSGDVNISGDETEEQITVIYQLTQQLEQAASTYKERLGYTFRQNLIRTVQNIIPPQLTWGKKDKKLARKSKSALSEIKSFLEKYWGESQTALNMLSLEVSVQNIKNRQLALLEDFVMEVEMEVKSKFLQSTNDFIEKIEKNKTVDLAKFKADPDIEHSLKENYEELHRKIVALTSQMPETLEVYPLNETIEETISIPVSTMAEHFINSRFNSPFAQSFDDFLASLQQSIYEAREQTKLTKIALGNPDAEVNEGEKDIYIKFSEALTIIKKYTEDQLDNLQETAFSNFEEAFMPMEPVHIIKSAESFSSELRAYQSHKVARGVLVVFENAYEGVKKSLSEIWYKRSNALLAAKSFGKKAPSMSQISQLLDLKTSVSPDESVLKALPKYYASLFTGRSGISKEFWISRPEEEQKFKQAASRFKAGYAGGILVIGSRNSGKTTFCNHLSKAAYANSDIYEVFPPITGSSNKEALVAALKKATQLWGSIDQVMTQLKPGSVIIINDMELFWEHHESGLGALRELQRLINEFGHKLLFVVNVNQYTASKLHQLIGLNDSFIEIIQLSQFNATELKKLVIKRHRTSGLEVSYKGKQKLTNFAIAKLFNAYFNYSQGHPGIALSGWLANISSANKEQLIIKKPQLPKVEVLTKLDNDWQQVLLQLILHKRMTLPRLTLVTNWNESKAYGIIKALLRSGMLMEKSTGVYHINPYVYPFLETSLKAEEIM